MKINNHYVKENLKCNEYIITHINNQNDVDKGWLSKDRLRYTKNALMFFYTDKALNVDNSRRNTYFELYFNTKRNNFPGINIVCSELVKKIMVQKGFTDITMVEKFNLPYNIHLNDDEDVISICQMLIDTYAENYGSFSISS